MYALCTGPGGQRRLGQQALRHPHPAGPPLRQGRTARTDPGRAAGAEAPGRRGAGGLPQRGQVHPAFRGQPGPAQDCQLPLYHPLSQPGGGLCGRGGVLRPGGYPRHHRGGQPGGRSGARFPPAYRPVPPAHPCGGRVGQRGAGPGGRF